MTPCSVLVVDDHPLFRRGIIQLLEMEESFTLVGEASSGQEGIALANRLKPNMVLLDLNMEGINGLETLKSLRRSCSAMRVIVVTVSDNPEDVVSALRLGAEGYLLKDMEPEDMLDCIKEIASGHARLSERLTGQIVQGLRDEGQPRHPDQAGLTHRELEILQCITNGMSNKMIARRLEITESTVKVHVKHILGKLNVSSRLQAALWVATNMNS